MAEESYTELELIILRYNKVAMDYLKYDKYKDTLILLKKAENILNFQDIETIPNRLKLISMTFNNLGCYYKKNKKPLVALSYLQRALELEIECNSDDINIAGSHLNICAVLSSLSRHEEALLNSKKAVSLLETAKKTRPDNLRLNTNLVISYYNSAAELEYVGKIQEAQSYYKKALDIIFIDLNHDHPLLNSLEHALAKVQDKLSLAKTDKTPLRDPSPLKNFLENKQIRFPSITPTVPKKRRLRSVMTPSIASKLKAGPYDNSKGVFFKGSM